MIFSDNEYYVAIQMIKKLRLKSILFLNQYSNLQLFSVDGISNLKELTESQNITIKKLKKEIHLSGTEITRLDTIIQSKDAELIDVQKKLEEKSLLREKNKQECENEKEKNLLLQEQIILIQTKCTNLEKINEDFGREIKELRKCKRISTTQLTEPPSKRSFNEND